MKRGSNNEQRLGGRNPGKSNGEMYTLTEMERVYEGKFHFKKLSYFRLKGLLS